MEPLIKSQRVEEMFMDSLFKDGEPTQDHVLAEGIVMNVGFHPARLEGHRAEVKEMLSNLPPRFFPETTTGGGGGWSFLNFNTDKQGTQWTDLHKRMEQLVLLGQALGMVKCLAPRALWGMFPGGMPYYYVTTE